MVSSQDEAGDILRAGFAWGFPGFCPGTVHAWGKGEMGEEDASAGGEAMEKGIDKGGWERKMRMPAVRCWRKVLTRVEGMPAGWAWEGEGEG